MRRPGTKIDPDLGSASQFLPLPFQWSWLLPLWRRAVGAGPRSDVAGVVVDRNVHGTVPLRLHRPTDTDADGDARQAVLWIHGGGFLMGTPVMDDLRCGRLARATGRHVAAASYRLAPEHRHPAALDDVHAAWHALLEHVDDAGGDPGRCAVVGASAGGGLAACLAQRLRDEGGPTPAAQVLLYPMLDDRTAADRARDRERHLVWTNRANRAGWRAYLGARPGADELPPYASAARHEDVSGLPPTWIGVGELDLFLGECRTYAERLRAAGVPVETLEVPGAPHGFDGIAPDAEPSKRFHHAMADFLERVA